jgi:hypothetical protein
VTKKKKDIIAGESTTRMQIYMKLFTGRKKIRRKKINEMNYAAEKIIVGKKKFNKRKEEKKAESTPWCGCGYAGGRSKPWFCRQSGLWVGGWLC